MTPPARDRLVWGLGVFAALSFVAGLLLAILDPGEVVVRSHEADSFSRSAVGHRGFVRWLRAVGVPVVVSRGDTAHKAGPGTVLALLEPPTETDPETLRALLDASDADALIVALPKWRPEAHGTERGYIGDVEPIDHDDRDTLLTALHLDARSVAADTGLWGLDGDVPPVDVTLTAPYGVDGTLEPRLVRGSAIVVGEASIYDRPLLLIADPDLISNAGFVPHAALLGPLLADLLDGRVLVVDETLHGHRSVASLARQLFEFPLVALTLQALAMALLAILAGVRRFGAPVPAPRGLGRGRRVLIENTAALGHHAGHDADALARYWQTTVRRVALALHTPPDVRGDDVLTWLARVGRARRITTDPRALSAEVHRARLQDPLAVARRIDAWRRALLATDDPARPRRN